MLPSQDPDHSGLKGAALTLRDFPLPFDARLAVLNTFFDCNAETEDGLSAPSNDSYFCYYRRLVENSKTWSIMKSHDDMLDLVRLIKQPEATRDYVENSLRIQLLDQESEEADEILEDTVNLAVRLLLMVSTGGFSSTGRSLTVSGETKFGWKDGTIKSLLRTQFTTQRTVKESVKLEKIFNAKNLEHIGGIKVRWTSNLADHLRMRDDDTAIELFHYASFLRFHQTCSIFPVGFVDETLRTLALLLPEHDPSLKQWFVKQEGVVLKRGKLPLDPSARECGQLKVEQRQMDNFDYWHDRLIILKQVFDEAEPSNITQWWNDRRKRVQWYTFWVAALVLGLTVFFGVIQSVEGALQLYVGYSQVSGSVRSSP